MLVVISKSIKIYDSCGDLGEIMLSITIITYIFKITDHKCRIWTKTHHILTTPCVDYKCCMVDCSSGTGVVVVIPKILKKDKDNPQLIVSKYK